MLQLALYQLVRYHLAYKPYPVLECVQHIKNPYYQDIDNIKISEQAN